MPLLQHITGMFEDYFGEPPAIIVRAPGRVNLIGEHTDYNDGFVLPLAIDRAVMIALRPRDDGRLLIHALDYGQTASHALSRLEPTNDGWEEYIKGVAWALQDAGYTLRGWEGVLAGDVPQGAGLSSSAALEMATARAFAAVSDIAWDAREMATLGQRADNHWVGINSGIMDHMISAAGRAGYALLIDCRTLETQPVALPSGVAVVVLDTATRRALVDSAYNERRAQCEAAARFFDVPALRDVSMDTFEARSDALDALIRRRARHVITENARTLQAVAALHQGDTVTLGQLLNASHASLRDDFEVSSDALDTIVDIARQQDGCYGARMTGAGFGGCAVALVQAEVVPAFAEQVAATYQAATGLTPSVYVCDAADGAGVVVKR